MRQVEAAAQPYLDSGEVTNLFLIAGSQQRQFRLHRPDARALGRARRARSRRSRRELNRRAAENPRRPGLGAARRTASASAAAARGCSSPSPARITTRSPTRRRSFAHALEDHARLRHACGSTTTPRSRSFRSRINRERASDLGVSVETLGTIAVDAARRPGDGRVLCRRRRDPGPRAGAGRHDRRSRPTSRTSSCAPTAGGWCRSPPS